MTKQCVKPGSKIVSDGHTSYKPLAQNGYRHEARAYYKEDKEDFLKSLHKVIGNVKAYILGTYHGLGAAYHRILMSFASVLTTALIRTKSLIDC